MITLLTEKGWLVMEEKLHPELKELFSVLPKVMYTYTCVGDLDPFRDEIIDYVLRLTQAGVPTEFHLYPGCFHGFEEYAPAAEISQRFVKEYKEALKRALHQ
ncbi:alpha/beta hydrolase [Paenibacillus enshidis]|uniref:Alpha/beta hydrolase n=1 Tax=Paenibacillus enshidis TaxID=1458439 RepID=A0ABV5AY59_9BACL